MADGVELLEPERIHLVEVPVQPLSAVHLEAMNQAWNQALLANPSLFDGPVTVGAGLDRPAPHTLVVSWSRTTYRRFALRLVPGAPVQRSLFVSVIQPTDDGRVLVGRMSTATAAVGRWQYPGGSVEPPPDDVPLDETALRDHAARELAEETGLDIPADRLVRCLVTHGEAGHIGVHYLAPPRPAPLVHQRYEALVAAERARGRAPEFDRIALIRSPADLTGLAGPHVAYLEPVLRRIARRVGS
ncbi:NUDIX domain-containing protein [Streptomyces sp. NPDC047072]|uniref:NUDIX domain-containing protein n=1 Tax=Streptomyces sp. NPDC047072 TaxID=3154809 RepID=UPI0033FFEC6D